MKVVVTGSHGLIGGALRASLQEAGHDVTRLVRGSAAHGIGRAVSWDPAGGTVDAEGLEGHDAVVHLAGAGVGDHRWTESYKAEIRDSRVRGTDLLARTLAALRDPPRVLASGSAVGFYGDRGDEELTEADGPGDGFLSEVVQAWEKAAEPANDAGIRVVRLRTGVVMSCKGGALRKQLLPFKLGIGGRLGTGRQYLSWIAITDLVAAITHTLADESMAGPVNLTAPNPVTNAEFTRTLGRVLHRPTVLPVPNLALHALFGREMTNDQLLGGQRVLPAALTAAGFTFAHPQLEPALRHELAG
ncbi:MAG: TIGR01777 family oxidoreductase [Acidimicrobiales bacterium]